MTYAHNVHSEEFDRNLETLLKELYERVEALETGPTDFERALAEYEHGLSVYGRSDWIDIARTARPDGSTAVSALKNPRTGEVRAR